MKYNFNKKFKDVNGSEAGDMVSVIVAQSLFYHGADKPVSRDDKFKAYKLSQKFINSPEDVELSTEEASFVKEVCGDSLTAGGYGQLCDIIEKGDA